MGGTQLSQNGIQYLAALLFQRVRWNWGGRVFSRERETFAPHPQHASRVARYPVSHTHLIGRVGLCLMWIPVGPFDPHGPRPESEYASGHLI